MTQILSGHIDKLYHPHFELEVYGISEKSSVKINPLLDTGFTGFLNLPLATCLQTGLILYSTTSYTLADGRTSSTILCLGTLLLPTKQKIVGVISIDFATSEPLLGIEFLKKIKGRFNFDITIPKVEIVIP